MLGLQHTEIIHADNNYSIIILCLRTAATTHIAHFVCVFVICTPAKRNKYAHATKKTLYDAFHSARTLLPFPCPARSHFISEWLFSILQAVENWHYANDVKISLCRRRQCGRSRDNPSKNNTLSVIILLLCHWNARSKHEKKRSESYVCAVCIFLPCKQRCALFFYYLLSVCQFFWRNNNNNNINSNISTMELFNFQFMMLLYVNIFLFERDYFILKMTGINRNNNNKNSKSHTLTHGNEWLRQRKGKKIVIKI